MRLQPAKEYVAAKLGVSIEDLVDPLVMSEVRREKGLGTLIYGECAEPTEPQVMEAKFHIADVLDIPIASVAGFKRRTTV
jgi:hypothetical protein